MAAAIPWHDVGAGCIALIGTVALCILASLKLDSLSNILKSGSVERLVVETEQKFEPLSKFCKDIVILCFILLFTYQCEYYPVFPHLAKEHDMDMFWFATLLFLAYSFTRWQKSRSDDLLGREQTEEWKGWMQFMFLLYHYCAASEVYNIIRVMITSYLWMTGFGNFSFFYIKKDYGIVRVLQMMWRLNFFVFLLMIVQGNTYILYYICPLHTFFFLATWLTMRVCSNLNYSKWGVRVKLFVVAVIIFTIWDAAPWLFDFIFGTFMGRAPCKGATSGFLYEWYFRTSLDHWSTFLGMIFALNYPFTNLWFKELAKLPAQSQTKITAIVAAVALTLMVLWFCFVFTLPKLQYNNTNAFLAPVPMLSYILLRNLTPLMRTWYCDILHDFGKTTLETYLLQHHVWLTSNAKTLLQLIPGHPKCNFFVCTILYFVLSRETHRLTMSLRAVVLPDSKLPCLRNTCLFFAVLGVSYGISFLLVTQVQVLFLRLGLLALIALAFTAGVFRILQRTSSEEYGNAVKDLSLQLFEKAPMLGLIFFLLLIFTLRMSNSSSSYAPSAMDCLTALSSVPGSWISTLPLADKQARKLRSGNHLAVSEVSSSWHSDSMTVSSCLGAGNAAKMNQVASCEMRAFRFDDGPGSRALGCNFRFLSKDSARAQLGKDARVVVFGDSEARNLYYSIRRAIGLPAVNVKAHEDLTPVGNGTAGMPEVAFVWAPRASDISSRLPGVLAKDKPHVLIMSFGLWDALHGRDLSGFEQSVQGLWSKLQETLPTLSVKPLTVWMPPPTIRDQQLNSKEKKQHMTEAQVEGYRQKAQQSLSSSGLPHFTVNLAAVTALDAAQLDSADGVHYSPIYYDTAAQLFLNGLTHAQRAGKVQVKEGAGKGKGTGGMADVLASLCMLVAVAFMLVACDSYAGLLPLLAAMLGGREMIKAVDLKSNPCPCLRPAAALEREHGGGEEGSEKDVETGQEREKILASSAS